MGRNSTNTTLIDETLTIKIKDLKRFDYLKYSEVRAGVLKWSSSFGYQSEVNISVNNNNSILTISYKLNGNPICYSVPIIYINSNLGKGKIPLFICPMTNKRCRNLYLLNGYFAHRTSSNNAMYESQTQSKHYRFLDKNFGKVFKLDSYYQTIYSKHFKTHYNNKPTRRYLSILKSIKLAELNSPKFDYFLTKGDNKGDL
jgi:hypothetical protein